MNAKRLFALLCHETWKGADPGASLQRAIGNFNEPDFEYLLLFCEVNRSDFIGRLTKENSLVAVEDLLCRILMLVHYKWQLGRDYRFLNLLAKFQRHYFGRLSSRSPEGKALVEEINQTLKNELNAGK